MMKLVLVAMVMESGNAEGAVVQVWNIVRYVAVRDIKTGITLAKLVVKQE